MRTPIIASEGKVLTNGEIYGKVIFLAEGCPEGGFYEIDEGEYRKMMEEENDEDSIPC